MMEFLGEPRAAAAIMDAMERISAERQALTPDLGGRATTDECGAAVCEALRGVAVGVAG